MSFLERIRWYTGEPDPHNYLRADYKRRERLLEAARQCEEIAAAYQQIADQIREAA